MAPGLRHNMDVMPNTDVNQLVEGLLGGLAEIAPALFSPPPPRQRALQLKAEYIQSL